MPRSGSQHPGSPSRPSRPAGAALVRALLCLALGSAAWSISPAWAGKEPAKDQPPPPDPAKNVRPDVAKMVNGAREQIGKEDYKGAIETLKPSLAIADLSPYEQYLVNRLRGVALVGAGDLAGADPVQEKVVADAFLAPEDKLTLDHLMAQRWYDKPPLTQAVKWARRYFADGGTDDSMHTVIIQSLFKAGDLKATIDEINATLAAGDAAGIKPSEARLVMLSECYRKVQDDAGHVAGLERLVTLYPKPVYWRNLLANLERKPGFEDYVVLDTYRLRINTGTMEEADDFIDMAELALRAGYPADAKRALDAGVAKGVLGGGKGGAKYETLRKRADNESEEDRKVLGQGDARAEKAPDGNPLFTIGLDYVTQDKFDQGLQMMQAGLERGHLKRPEQARLQLGEAYVRAGRKDEALKAFALVKGEDGSADLARLWTLYLQGGK